MGTNFYAHIGEEKVGEYPTEEKAMKEVELKIIGINDALNVVNKQVVKDE